ncbi:hypothetical protein VPHD528_0137 [Vibrio phage D528]
MCVIKTLERVSAIHYEQQTLVLSSGFNLHSPQYCFDLSLPSFRKALADLLSVCEVPFELLQQDREWTLQVPAYEMYKLKGRTVVVPSLFQQIKEFLCKSL